MPCLADDTVLLFAEGRLGAVRRRMAATHIDGCDECRELVAEAARAEHEVLPPGSAVGRYRVLRTLGAGGMGIVYEAHDPQLRRRIALKLHRSGVTDAEPMERVERRLLAEAQAMAQLAHPNVVAVHDAGLYRGRVFVAMELVDGITLRRWMRQERTSWEVTAVFAQAARGLAAAHAAGLVHRDFKPENVLVGADGRVRVTDFGLACAPAAVLEDQTRPDLVLGTPPYMAPEQARGDAVDGKADQFSFCVALHEALCGRRPIAPRFAPELGARVPAALAAVVARGLSLDPAGRFASMDELVAALWPIGAPRRHGGRALAVALALAAAAVAVLRPWRSEPQPSAPPVAIERPVVAPLVEQAP